jgi:hypothetical protein
VLPLLENSWCFLDCIIHRILQNRNRLSRSGMPRTFSADFNSPTLLTSRRIPNGLCNIHDSRQYNQYQKNLVPQLMIISLWMHVLNKIWHIQQYSVVAVQAPCHCLHQAQYYCTHYQFQCWNNAFHYRDTVTIASVQFGWTIYKYTSGQHILN